MLILNKLRLKSTHLNTYRLQQYAAIVVWFVRGDTVNLIVDLRAATRIYVSRYALLYRLRQRTTNSNKLPVSTPYQGYV